MNLASKVALSAVIGIGVAGCGGSGAGAIGQQQPRVRLFNSIDGESSVTATYEDSTLKNLGTSTAAAFGGTSNDTIIPNTNVTATVSGPSGPLFTTASALFRIGDYYTIYSAGSVSSGTYKSLVLQDAENSAPQSQVGIRVVHVGVSTPASDIIFSATNTPQTGTGIQPLFSDVTYATVSSSANTTQAVDANGYTLVSIPDGGYYTVEVTNHGSATPIASVSSAFATGNYYTIVVFDATAGGTSVLVEADHRTD